jgi:hypothetical protein
MSVVMQVEDWGSGAYSRGEVLSESFGWKDVKEMQVGMWLNWFWW